MMKKTLSILLVLLLMIGMLPLSASAADGLRFSLQADKQTLTVGEEITFTVSVSGTGTASSLGYIPDFSEDVFELTAAKCTMTQNVKYSDADKTTGDVVILFDTPAVPSGAVGTFTLRVKALPADGSAEVTVLTSVKNDADTVPSTADTVTLSKPQPQTGSLEFGIQADKQTLTAGEEIAFTVTVSGTGEVSSLGYIPEFSADVFELTAAKCTMTQNVKYSDADKTTGDVVILFDTPAAPSGTVGTFTLRVKALPAGGSAVVTLTASAKNDDLTVPVSAGSVTLSVPAACTHSYTYAVTTAPTVSAPGTLTGTCSKCQDAVTVTLPKLDETNYTYSVTKAASCTADGTGTYTWKTTTYGTFSFEVTISKTGHTYSGGVCTQCGAADPNADTAKGVLTVEKKTAHPGDTVEISLNLDTNPGIIGMSLCVDFDSSVLTLTKVEDSGLIPGGDHQPSLGSPYYLMWNNDTASANITSTGKLVTLTFTVADNAPEGGTSVTVSYDRSNYDIFDFSGRAVDFNIVNGEVAVSHLILGDVNGDGVVNARDRLLLARYLAKWNNDLTLNLEAADVDQDGRVTFRDRMILSRHVANWEDYKILPYIAD